MIGLTHNVVLWLSGAVLVADAVLIVVLLFFAGVLAIAERIEARRDSLLARYGAEKYDAYVTLPLVAGVGGAFTAVGLEHVVSSSQEHRSTSLIGWLYFLGGVLMLSSGHTALRYTQAATALSLGVYEAMRDVSKRPAMLDALEEDLVKRGRAAGPLRRWQRLGIGGLAVVSLPTVLVVKGWFGPPILSVALLISAWLWSRSKQWTYRVHQGRVLAWRSELVAALPHLPPPLVNRRRNLLDTMLVMAVARSQR